MMPRHPLWKLDPSPSAPTSDALDLNQGVALWYRGHKKYNKRL